MNELLLLVDDNGRGREVFARRMSIGMSEFYQAAATEYRPELKFVIADYLDYNDEMFVRHESKWYRVIRTYRAGQELELTLTRASAEEVDLFEQES